MTAEFASSRVGRWSSRASTAALLLLVAAVLVPDGFLWTAVVCTGLIGSALVTAAVLGRRAVPAMAEVIAGNSTGAAQRSKGD